ncbi:hypothetical protein DFH08DRAFT_1085120 [Mycena albidolilacea]|uniref:Uncharacterized protein n=1 Tax=Mycena albidolilacea TaxID=1033008 RepID=A0AAD6ZKM2_9AGAR|nr:hypothetical protein DFH08DRAFT_1085120 [Mycena albidolilacea]
MNTPPASQRNHASTALAVVVAATATPEVFEWKLGSLYAILSLFLPHSLVLLKCSDLFSAPAPSLRPLYPPLLPRGAVPPGRRIIPSIHFRLLGYPGSLLPRPGLRRSFRLPAPCAKLPGLDDILYDALHTLCMRSPLAAVAISGLGEVPRDVLHMPHYAHARRWPPVRTLARRSRRCTDLVHDPRLALRLMALHTQTHPPPAAVALAQRRLACPHRALHLCAQRMHTPPNGMLVHPPPRITHLWHFGAPPHSALCTCVPGTGPISSPA